MKPPQRLCGPSDRIADGGCGRAAANAAGKTVKLWKSVQRNAALSDLLHLAVYVHSLHPTYTTFKQLRHT